MNSTNNKSSHNQTQGKRLGFGFLLVCVAVVVIVACKEVSYRDPQPKGIRSLPQVPTRLQGNYLFKDEKGEADTIVITSNSFSAKSDPKDKYTLSDTLIMKTYKGYYFISKRDETTWLLRIVRQEKNGDLSYLAMDDKDFNAFLLRLSREVRIDSVDLGKGMIYQIDPSPKQLVELIEKGYFAKEAVMKKIK
jgi:hypothetical protein